MVVAYLLDTNILLRGAEPKHPMHLESVEAVAALLAVGETVCVVPQNFTEFWVVGTKPVSSNGLGFTTAEAEAELVRIENLITLLPETPRIFTEWRKLVNKYSVQGKVAHDARIAAAAIANGIENIVTFNDSDFKRFTEIIAFTPSEIISTFT